MNGIMKFLRRREGGRQTHFVGRKVLHVALMVALVVSVFAALILPAMAEPSSCEQVTGAIWTTDANGNAVNQNPFDDKEDVYLNGGSDNDNKKLPDGDYYIKVTEPNGTLLGTTLGSAQETYTPTNGTFNLLRLSQILIKASSSAQGYDDTGYNGGEYKVWVSLDRDFSQRCSKTDNFKVGPSATIPTPPATIPTPPATIPTPPATSPGNGGESSTLPSTSPPASVLGEVVSVTTTLASETPVINVAQETATTDAAPVREGLPFTGLNGLSILAALLLVATGAFIYRTSTL